MYTYTYMRDRESARALALVYSDTQIVYTDANTLSARALMSLMIYRRSEAERRRIRNGLDRLISSFEYLHGASV